MLAIDSGNANTFLLELLLDHQQQTTAVEKFAQLHERDELPLQAMHYRQLMPMSRPAAGEQYAFEVDLDACSGCKACVTACHNLNGLEENEVWRSVGLLHGGTTELPVIQHVTTACHHCVEPACLHGCPVKAFEKDPVTGIVKHLDDQCIGCQYCMLKCPYDVPKYSKSKGIVRKCDMCSDRLAADEAPACVQACPNQAIRISIVNQQQVIEECESNVFLPGVPEPEYTLPTTIYKSQRVMPRNVLPADYYNSRPAHAHTPLIVMLVLTQMSVGAFVVEQFLQSKLVTLAGSATIEHLRPAQLISALLLGLLGLSAAIFHLGRPRLAYRAFIGLATSWLSREILAFTLFAGLASAYVAVACAGYVGWNVSPAVEAALGISAGAAGVLAVVCSMMIYIDTRRVFWGPLFTVTKFFGTSLVLGIPVALLISLAAAACAVDLTIDQILSSYGRRLCHALIVIAGSKLIFEAMIFGALRNQRHTPLKRTALLLKGELSMIMTARFIIGGMGGILLPLILLGERQLAPVAGFQPLFIGIFALLMAGLCMAGEFIERYLFFTAVVAPKMPGTQAT
ncbi:MAG: dimethyl sulfoxide reductase anchor subunit [Planctomycetota bacterium]|nr:dimethyl sulfoxide reductase anchor subunit [Planctomycetota bacterium]